MSAMDHVVESNAGIVNAFGRVYVKLDSNQDGYISLADLRDAILFGISHSKDEVTTIWMQQFGPFLQFLSGAKKAFQTDWQHVLGWSQSQIDWFLEDRGHPEAAPSEPEPTQIPTLFGLGSRASGQVYAKAKGRFWPLARSGNDRVKEWVHFDVIAHAHFALQRWQTTAIPKYLQLQHTFDESLVHLRAPLEKTVDNGLTRLAAVGSKLRPHRLQAVRRSLDLRVRRVAAKAKEVAAQGSTFVWNRPLSYLPGDVVRFSGMMLRSFVPLPFASQQPEIEPVPNGNAQPNEDLSETNSADPLDLEIEGKRARQAIAHSVEELFGAIKEAFSWRAAMAEEATASPPASPAGKLPANGHVHC